MRRAAPVALRETINIRQHKTLPKQFRRRDINDTRGHSVHRAFRHSKF
jgi:hypothetical protein